MLGPQWAEKHQPHNTMQPYLPVTVCIALVGAFPSV
jgi:microcystin-dependent protein